MTTSGSDRKYQIFLSSIYLDLMDYRESAVKTILRLNHIPVGMEMFNAGDEDQWSLIKNMLDLCD